MDGINCGKIFCLTLHIQNIITSHCNQCEEFEYFIFSFSIRSSVHFHLKYTTVQSNHIYMHNGHLRLQLPCGHASLGSLEIGPQLSQSSAKSDPNPQNLKTLQNLPTIFMTWLVACSHGKLIRISVLVKSYKSPTLVRLFPKS